MTSSSPVLLSSCGEAQRCYQVGTALTRLLSLPVPLAEEDDEFKDQLNEILDLRETVHQADLDRCTSSKRLAILKFAFDNDATLANTSVWGWSESQRQAFWNDISDRIKAGNFDGFAFGKGAFDAYWEGEKHRRSELAASHKFRLEQLESRCEERLQGWLGQCGNALTPEVWSALDACSEEGARVDALVMNGPSSVWFATEMQHPPQQQGLARDLVLVVDLSGSMCDAIGLLKEVLIDIVHQATHQDRICIIGFSTTTNLVSDWTQAGTAEANAALQRCIDTMESGGGTNLVPAMQMVQMQLSALEALQKVAAIYEAKGSTEQPPLQLMPCMGHRVAQKTVDNLTPSDALPPGRMVAVVLLSDGDPEEPAESVQQITGQALRASINRPDAAVVTLALGARSNPAMMAMTAQCGGGVSLYIPSNDHMAEQLGRMWGYFNALGERRETMVILQPVGGAVILDAERPLGGLLSLHDASGSQAVVLRCGAGLAGSAPRFAAQLQLPEWASNQLEAHMLHHPLVRATWLWREGPHNTLKASRAELRVVGVPSLFVEAQLGVPVRVVLDSEQDPSDFDGERFLTSLAAALHVPRETLQLQRITKGSIIADVRFVSSNAEELANVQEACEKASDIGCALAQDGYSMIDILTPGRAALQRGLQWRYAQALEMLGNTDEQALPMGCNLLEHVKEVAASGDALCMDAGAGGVVAAIQADTAVISDMLASAPAGDLKAAAHAILQQAYAHCQQMCPENNPTAVSVRGYEVPEIRSMADGFAQRAACRRIELPAIGLEHVVDSTDALSPGDVTLRVHSDGSTEAATAFRFQISTTLPGQEGNVIVDDARTPSAALTFTFRNLSDGPLQCVAAATDGVRMGPWSEPVLFQISRPDVQESELRPQPPKSPQQPQRTRRASTNSSSAARRRRSPSFHRGVRVVHAELSPPDAVHLSWTVHSANASGWQVSFQALSPEGHTAEAALTHHVSETSIWIDGLRPSTAFKFRIEAVPKANTTRARQGTPQGGLGGDGLGLCIQGRSMSLSSGPLPPPAEGVIAVPPHTNEVLHMLDGDQELEKFQDGIYLSRAPSS